jgi:nitrogen fixation NifU-like protein
MNLYQAALMDHYRHPQNRGELENPDFISDEHNPSCGDSISMQGHIKNDKINAIAFQGKGCVISQATASMLTQECKDKGLDEVLGLDASFVLILIGMNLGPTRLKCALLPLQALHQGIISYKKNKSG